MVLNSCGGVDSYNDYYPYGEQMPGRNSAGSADGRYKFTSKEPDTETGLDYFGARYYDQRFAVANSWRGQCGSVDALAGKTPDWGPYAYADDNPIGNIDEEGKYAVNVVGGYIEVSRFSPTMIGLQQGAELLPFGIGLAATLYRGARHDRWWTPNTSDYAQALLAVFGGKILGTMGDILLTGAGGTEALSEQRDLTEAFNVDKEVFDKLLSLKFNGVNLFLGMKVTEVENGVATKLELSNGQIIMLNPKVTKILEWILGVNNDKNGQQAVANYIDKDVIDPIWRNLDPSLYKKLTRDESQSSAAPEDQYNAEYGSPPGY